MNASGLKPRFLRAAMNGSLISSQPEYSPLDIFSLVFEEDISMSSNFNLPKK